MNDEFQGLLDEDEEQIAREAVGAFKAFLIAMAIVWGTLGFYAAIVLTIKLFV